MLSDPLFLMVMPMKGGQRVSRETAAPPVLGKEKSMDREKHSVIRERRE
jgi:hypothetical protein